MTYPIQDWDDAYANSTYIEGGSGYPERWPELARVWREAAEAAGRARLDLAYGPGPRHRLDLFLPVGTPKGLVVFVHGGYWKAFDKSVWSHLAQGAVASGYAMAMPSYPLAPEARIGEIVLEIAAAIAFAGTKVDGDIRLCGHSAGGHLVARMICQESPLPGAVAVRVKRVVSISGVHDLRPLMRTRMNVELKVDGEEARHESPALLAPREGSNLVCWVGADERPEFLRQNRILAEMWRGFDVTVEALEEPGRHHFDVIEGLVDENSRLMRALLG